jgi:hypothetical protein
MVVYMKRTKTSLKWLLAIVVFILALTITFSEADGINIPPGHAVYQYTGNNSATTANHSVLVNHDRSNVWSSASGTGPDKGVSTVPVLRHPDDPGSKPVAVPEPSTLLLVSTGLCALYGLRKKSML